MEEKIQQSTLSDPLVPAIDLNYEIFTVILCFTVASSRLTHPTLVTSSPTEVLYISQLW